MNLSELSYDFIGVNILDVGLLLFIIYLVLKDETMDRKIVKGYYQSCILTIVVIICEIMTETLHTKLAEIWRQADQNLYDNKKAKKARRVVPGRKE